MLKYIKKIIWERTILLTNIYFVRHAHSAYSPDELGSLYLLMVSLMQKKLVKFSKMKI